MMATDNRTDAAQAAERIGGRLLAFGAQPVSLDELGAAHGIYWLAAYGYVHRDGAMFELTESGRAWFTTRPAICVDCLDYVRGRPRGFTRCLSCEPQP